MRAAGTKLAGQGQVEPPVEVRDLLVISGKLTYADKLRIREAIEEKIGARKVDIVISCDVERPFVRIGMNEGVLL